MKAIVVLFDTLCRRFLSPYGSDKIATPNMENKCFHIADDYHQLFDLCGTAAEKPMRDMLVNAVKDADCPEEQFKRLGLK